MFPNEDIRQCVCFMYMCNSVCMYVCGLEVWGEGGVGSTLHK